MLNRFLITPLLIISGCATVSNQPIALSGTPGLKDKSALIEFTPGSSGDFEEYIFDALIELGINTKIQYPSSREDLNEGIDWLVKYEDEMRWDLKPYLGYLNIEIYEIGTNKLLGSGNYESSLLHGFPDEREVTFNLVNKIFGLKTDYSRPEINENKVSLGKTWNIRTQIHKLDRSLYYIFTEGAGSRSLQEVQKAILLNARKIANGHSFQYSWNSETYQYSSNGPVVTGSSVTSLGFTHQGQRVFAVIKILEDTDGIETEVDNLALTDRHEPVAGGDAAR